MLKKSAGNVLALLRPSTYPRGYALGPSLATALLDGHFEHPAGYSFSIPQMQFVDFAEVHNRFAAAC